jgi:hypothetical protein
MSDHVGWEDGAHNMRAAHLTSIGAFASICGSDLDTARISAVWLFLRLDTETSAYLIGDKI